MVHRYDRHKAVHPSIGVILQEAGGEEGEEAVAPLGRIQLQDRQMVPATAAGGGSSGGFGPRVVIRDGKTVVDEDSLTFHCQVQLLHLPPVL